LVIILILIFSLSAKALDEYASIKTRASKATEEEENIDPRLEAIVERMLEKYDNILLLCDICQFIRWVMKSYFIISGVSLMENINRPWVWLLNAGGWISWRKQLFGVIIFKGLYRIASTFLINMLITVNIALR